MITAYRLRVLCCFLPLVAATLGLGACSSGNESTGEPARRDTRQPTEQFFDYRLVETRDGIPEWTLDSSEMRKYSEQEDVQLVTVKMDFYREGAHFSTLTSDSGSAQLQTRDIHTWGNVVVVTDDGRRLETEELFFSNETQLIHNDVYNVFTRGTDVVTGIGLEATPDLDYIEIKQRVEARVQDQTTGTGSPRATESEHH